VKLVGEPAFAGFVVAGS